MSDREQLSALGKQSTTFASKLDAELAELRAFLMSKNQAYGDSALNPVRVFSKSGSTEQLRVRIDDKISRLMRGGGVRGRYGQRPDLLPDTTEDCGA